MLIKSVNSQVGTPVLVRQWPYGVPPGSACSASATSASHELHLSLSGPNDSAHQSLGGGGSTRPIQTYYHSAGLFRGSVFYFSGACLQNTPHIDRDGVEIHSRALECPD